MRHRFLYATLLPPFNYSSFAEVNFKSRPVSADTARSRRASLIFFQVGLLFTTTGLATGFYGSWFIVYIGRPPRFARHSLNQTGTGSAAIIGFARAVRLNALCIEATIKSLWIVATCLDCNRTFVAKREKYIGQTANALDFRSSTHIRYCLD